MNTLQLLLPIYIYMYNNYDTIIIVKRIEGYIDINIDPSLSKFVI